MEASKSRFETLDILPLVREQEDEKRRHVRFPGSVAVLAFAMALFCAACLTITLRCAAQVSDLQERMERLESDVKWSSGKGLHQSSSAYPEEGDLDDVSSTASLVASGPTRAICMPVSNGCFFQCALLLRIFNTLTTTGRLNAARR